MLKKNNLTKFFSFYEWLNYLENYKLNSISYDLNRVFYVAKKLGVLKPKAFIFIVGGTNGKGTTCHVLERLLLDLGYHVGLYTSPHLIKYEERVRINGSELEEHFHVQSFNDVKSAQDSTLLTHFEFITLSALILFKNFNLDVIILEVGLGGRLDATNILNSDISVITNIDIDHTNILGKDKQSISIEKIGIFRKNKIAVIAEKNPHDIVRFFANRIRINLKVINVDWSYKKFNSNWMFFNNRVCFSHLPIPKLSIKGFATAISAILESGIIINKNNIIKCISNVVLQGRCQIISYSPTIILDVAHNSNSSIYLSKKLISLKLKGKIYALVGILKNKDINGILKPLLPMVNYWYCVKLQTNRSISTNQIIKYLPYNISKKFENMEIALNSVLKIVKNIDIIVIFGSFFSVREAISFFKNNKNTNNHKIII